MKANNIFLSFANTIIFDDVSFQLPNDTKCGVVGVNGAGKTTLFRLILGEVELDKGELNFGSKKRIGYLPQIVQIESSDETVYDFIYDGRPIKKIQKELEEIYARLSNGEDNNSPLLKRMGRLQDELEMYDVYNAENILLELIINMNIDLDLLYRPLKSLSGGEKSKVAFARLLYSNPDILLLDEPTNHLDVETKSFVTSFLKNYHGEVLIISHDIDFLNSIVDHILYIDKANHHAKVYKGDYNHFLKQYEEEKRLKELARQRQEKEMKNLEAFILKAKQASQTNHAIKRMKQDREVKLSKLKKVMIQKEQAYKKVKLAFSPRHEGGHVPLAIENLRFGYDENHPLYEDLSFRIGDKERFLIVGENGVGKSTLLKLIIGKLCPQDGKIRINPKTEIAYYAQELENLEEDKTILENVKNDEYSEWQLRSLLANFLFFEDDINKKIKVLSPGEKARVSLCKLLLKRANLLILDEPTNHLDPETQLVIGLNFALFEGTIILVSHNPTFVSQIGINRMLILPYGRVENYSEELLDYYYLVNTEQGKKSLK